MAVIVISRFLYFLNHAAMGLITMEDLFKMMVIVVSLFSVHVFLLSFYLAMIFVLSRYFSEHEMTALFASGFSRMHLMGYMMVLALLVSVVVAAMVLWLEPMATYSKDVVFSEAMTSAELAKILPNRLETLENGDKMIYVAKVGTQKGQRTLQNVTLIQHQAATKSQSESWDISTAKTAEKVHVKGSSYPFIELDHGHRVGVQPGKLSVDAMSFAKYGVGVMQNRPNIAVAFEGMPTSYLWQHRHQYGYYVAGLQYRFSIILSVFLLTLIAVPLSYVAPREGRYIKLIPALIIYLAYMGLVLSNKSWLAHADRYRWFFMVWLQAGLLLLGLIFFRYGMGPLTHRYKNRLKRVLLPWRHLQRKSHAD